MGSTVGRWHDTASVNEERHMDKKAKTPKKPKQNKSKDAAKK
jgi:hypothetical protein